MTVGQGLSLIFGNWFVSVIVAVHAMMLLGFFLFIWRPQKKATRVVLAVSLFGVCGGMIALASGRELVQMLAGL